MDFPVGTASVNGHKEWAFIYVILHEVGHALDFFAYPDPPLSSSKEWEDAYNADSKVPDSYSQKNIKEDLAQTTVVAAYDLLVPVGLATFPGNRDWSTIHHQYELIKKKQAEAGGLLLPGGTCSKRLRNANVVKIPTEGKARRATMLKGKPNVELAPGLEIIEPHGDYSTEGSCISHEH